MTDQNNNAITFKQALNQATAKLTTTNIQNPYLDALILLELASNKTREQIFIDLDDILDFDIQEKYSSLIEERNNNKPIAYIANQKEFWSLQFYVNESTLIPRPDSEILIEAVLKLNHLKKPNIIDLGTGSGCLIISILSEIKDATGIGIDASNKAIEIAKINAKKHNLDNRCNFVNKDWNEICLKDFNIIISNPPYLKTDDKHLLSPELKHEPICALVSGNSGIECYKEIIDLINKDTKKNILCFFEIGYNQANQIRTLILENSLNIIAEYKDLSNITRVIAFNKNII